jgi:peptide chain release factor
MNNYFWIQISAGQGPKECGWVAAQVCNQMHKYAKSMNLSYEIIESTAFEKYLRKQDLIEADAIRSALVRIEGKQADKFVNAWHGTILWRGFSIYRPTHKRWNWFVGVKGTKANPANTPRFEQLKNEVKVDAIRSSGPGGQHINKTNSAVRLTHTPTGMTVRVDSDRSQHRNRAIAMEQLELMLQDKDAQTMQAINRDRWTTHLQLERGNPKKTFYGEGFKEE